jgi:hypothetical protein
LPKGLLALLAAFLVIAAIAFYPREENSGTSTASIPAPAAPAARPGPQPGPAPPGKVWSTEHGHWHDAAPAQSPIRIDQTPRAPVTQTVANVPQPPGPVPPGKVWSKEHGHWHDAPK